MNRTPVTSTSILSVGYDDLTFVLEVEFATGRIYQYFDVPRAHFDAMLTAGSVGAYFNANIRDVFAYSAA